MLAGKFRPPFERIYILIGCRDEALSVTAVLKSEQTAWHGGSHLKTRKCFQRLRLHFPLVSSQSRFLLRFQRRPISRSHSECIRRLLQPAAAFTLHGLTAMALL